MFCMIGLVIQCITKDNRHYYQLYIYIVTDWLKSGHMTCIISSSIVLFPEKYFFPGVSILNPRKKYFSNIPTHSASHVDKVLR